MNTSKSMLHEVIIYCFLLCFVGLSTTCCLLHIARCVSIVCSSQEDGTRKKKTGKIHELQEVRQTW